MKNRTAPLTTTQMAALRDKFSAILQENVSLSDYTTAHVGGKADALLPVNTMNELADAVNFLWSGEIPFMVIGGGSNVLASDEGYHGVLLLNRARNTRIDVHTQPVIAFSESGANLGSLARQTALRGLSGLEWAANIPGTVGGAVYGNAGAFGSDMAASLYSIEMVCKNGGRQSWSPEQMAYQYRSSILKREPVLAVVLAASFKLSSSTPDAVQAIIGANTDKRKHSQPPGASMGSVFKNPPGDFAGRLIEAANLKGYAIGGAEVSPIHANFIVNHSSASATDIWKLIRHIQSTVADQFGIQLELEIELLGHFPDGEF